MPPSVPTLTPPTTARSSEDPLSNGGTQKWEETPTRGHEGQQTIYNAMTGSTGAAVEDHVGNHGNANFSSPMLPSPYGNAYGGIGGGGMYGNYGGYNTSMYGGGMYGGGGMMSPYGMMSPGPISSLNQFLFSIQSVIFSLGQAVQIIGMNTQGLKQLLESATAMFDHAVQTWHEMQTLEQKARHHETEEDRKRRRRLRAMRMALVAGISYLGYRLVRRLLFPPRRPTIADGSYYRPSPYASSPHQSMYNPYSPGVGAGYYP